MDAKAWTLLCISHLILSNGVFVWISVCRGAKCDFAYSLSKIAWIDAYWNFYVSLLYFPAIFVSEEDVGIFTIRAVDDPRTLNKILYVRPPGNIFSQNELVSLWEKKTGKTFKRVYVTEEEVLNQIQGTCLTIILVEMAKFQLTTNFSNCRVSISAECPHVSLPLCFC